MIYYKVVDKNLKSFVNQDYSIQYKIGEFVEPLLKGSKLFVYNNLVAASLLAGKYGGKESSYRIFLCETINPKNLDFILELMSFKDKLAMELFWTKNKLMDTYANTDIVLVDQVKLLEEYKFS